MRGVVMWRSFLPREKYDHPVSAHATDDGAVVVTVGGNRRMSSVMSPEGARELSDHLRLVCDALARGPDVKPVAIVLGPPPVPTRDGTD